MSYDDYVDLLRTYRWSIVGFTLGGLLAAVLVTASLPPTYTAQAQVLFTSGDGQTGQDLAYAGQYVQARMTTYAELARSRQVLQPVMTDLQLKTSYPDLADEVSASAAPLSNIMRITATTTSPTRSQAIAMEVSQWLITAVQDRELAPPDKKGDEPRRAVVGVLVTAPEAPRSPSGPSYRGNAAGGTLLGLLAGLAVALVRRSRRAAAPDAGDIPDLVPVPAADVEQQPAVRLVTPSPTQAPTQGTTQQPASRRSPQASRKRRRKRRR